VTEGVEATEVTKVCESN